MRGHTIITQSVLRGVLLCGLMTLRCVADVGSLQQIASDSGLRVSLAPDGAYRVTASKYGWTFGGAIGRPVQNITVSDGSDGVGSFIEITFDYDTLRYSGIRLYNAIPVALFSTTYGLAGPNTDTFPHFATYPQDLFTFSYNGLWDYW